MAFSAKKIRQFKCPNCGGELQLQNARTKYVACPYCGTTADASTDAYKILTKAENPNKFPPRSFLKLGMTGEIYGKAYKIIGRTCWRSRYKEYWSEDGETGYSDETWTFDEWLLINEDGGYKTIIEDSEGYSFSDTLIPKFPILPRENSYVPDFRDGKTQQRVQEYGTSDIRYFEGESTYLVAPGNKAGFSEYRTFSTAYIAEWRFDDKNQIKEIEFFEERKIKKADLMDMFRNDPSIREKLENAELKRKENKINKYVMVFTGLALFIYAVFFTGDNYNYHNTFTEVFNPYEAEKTQPWKSLNDSTEVLSIVSSNLFPATVEDVTIDLSLTPSVSDSSECRMTLFVLDDKSDTLYAQSGFYYQYTKGYYPDSTEYDYQYASNTSGFFQSFLVKFEKNENLRIGVSFEVPKKRKLNDTLSTNVSVYSSKPHVNTGFAIIIGLLLIAVGLFFKTRKNNLLK